MLLIEHFYLKKSFETFLKISKTDSNNFDKVRILFFGNVLIISGDFAITEKLFMEKIAFRRPLNWLD